MFSTLALHRAILLFITISYYLPITLCSNFHVCNYPTCNCSAANTPKWISVTCRFSKNEDISINENELPGNLLEFEVLSGGSLKLQSQSFSKIKGLRKIKLYDIRNLLIEKHAFLNLSSNLLNLEVANCERVEAETNSLYLNYGPVSITIFNCSNVLIHSFATSWLLSIIISSVSKLEFERYVFSQELQKSSRHGTPTKITLENVTMLELPANSFSSPTAEIRMKHVDIATIRKDTFSALELYYISIENGTFDVIEEAAFSDKTIICKLEIINTHVRHLQSYSILSGVSDFIIMDSSIDVISKEAFSMKAVAAVTCVNNTFNLIKNKGLSFKNWNTLLIENNTFKKLHENSIDVSYHDEEFINDSYVFSFVGNLLVEVSDHFLTLFLNRSFFYTIKDNIFLQSCKCNFNDWLELSISTNEEIEDLFFDTSYCSIGTDLAICLRYPERFMTVPNFTDYFCKPSKTITCDGTVNKIASISFNPNVLKAMGILIGDRPGYEKKVFNSIILAALIGTCIMLVVSLIVWLRSKQCLNSSRLIHANCLFSSPVSIFLSIFSRILVSQDLPRTTSSSSITRVSVHEYAELHMQKGNDNTECTETITYLDKATQTLPEELTQELLRNLKEKLDDPDNYAEARNTIEQLYDLIKVEENCNNNTFCDYSQINEMSQEELLLSGYDVLQKKTVKKSNIPVASKEEWTQVSWLDIPFCNTGENQVTVLSDYTQPCDQVVYTYHNDQLPTYTSDQKSLSQSIYCSLDDPELYATSCNLNKTDGGKMFNRPLPIVPDKD